MKKGFEKVRDTWIFKLFCAVLCAACATLVLFLILMVLMGRFGDYHGLTDEEITALATDRICRDRMGSLLNAISMGSWPDSQAVYEDREGEYRKLEEIWKRKAKDHYNENSGDPEYAVIVSAKASLSELDLDDEELYLFKSPGYRQYGGSISGRIFHTGVYIRRNMINVVLEEDYGEYEDYLEDTTGFGTDYYVYILYQPIQQLDSSVRSFLDQIAWADRYGIVSGILLCILGLISLVLFCSSVGHRRGKEGICPSLFERIPLELVAGAILLAGWLVTAFSGVALVAFFGGSYRFEKFDINDGTIYACIVCFVLALAAILLFGTLAVRIKARIFWSSTLTGRIFKLAGKFFRGCAEWVGNNVPLSVRLIVALAVIAVVSLGEAGVMRYGSRKLVLLFIPARATVIILLIYLVWGYSRLRAGAKRIAEGKLDEPVDLRYLSPDYRLFANNLNSVGEGIQLAVEERMKSERLKTQLITNVSHDIKTPLTSIINYVDLLQRKDATEEEKKEYLEILSKQSDRLKKLIQDLIDASKASSGAVEVELEETDLATLFRQVSGEYHDKFEEGKLTLIPKKLEEEIPVCVDSNLLWRVMDNLFGNVLKYAMPGTRVYAEAGEQDGMVTFSILNISKAELGISGDELMERFVRGDKSRNTEGSGLGLSIAKSLMELMGGSLMITVDGDMFKAVLRMRKDSADL